MNTEKTSFCLFFPIHFPFPIPTNQKALWAFFLEEWEDVVTVVSQK